MVKNDMQRNNRDPLNNNLLRFTDGSYPVKLSNSLLSWDSMLT